MLDSITWGNPLQKHLQYLEPNKSFLEKHVIELTKFLPPKNSSKASREELNAIVDYLADINKEKATLARYISYDTQSVLKPYAKLILEKDLKEAGQIIDDIIDDVLPLVYKLKFYFQRPRPYQLANHYKLKCFPYSTKSGDSPSYPCLSVVQAKLISYVMGNHFPQHFDLLDKIATDIEYSRQYLGLNYASDIDYSIYIVETITKDPEFKGKYRI
jgi:hypothetical protein